MTSNAATYSVGITMDESTVNALVQSQYYLYALKAVQSSDAATRPLIWLQTQGYSEHTNLSGGNEYGGYTSTSAISPGHQVDVGFSTAVALGELLTITQPSGIGAVTTDGTANMISIFNKTSDQFTCGICEKVTGGEFGPICAMPLYGQGLQLVVPVPKILLLFATMSLPPGTAITVAPSQGLLIDQASAPACTVSFDINAGWSANGAPYAQVIAPLSNLVPLIAQYSSLLASLVQEFALRTGTQ